MQKAINNQFEKGSPFAIAKKNFSFIINDHFDQSKIGPAKFYQYPIFSESQRAI